MDAEQFREDFRAGRIDGEKLIDLLVAMQRNVAQLQLCIEELETRGGPPTAKLDEAFSLRAEERRQATCGSTATPLLQPPSFTAAGWTCNRGDAQLRRPAQTSATRSPLWVGFEGAKTGENG